MTATVASPWLPLPAEGGLPLFCLPHAGGSASAFRTWQAAMPGLAVLPVQPPGREGRFREPTFDRIDPLVAELATVVSGTAGERPYAVYGHSLGGLVTFELLRELRRRGEPGPVAAIVSGCVAPQCVTPDARPVYTMSPPEVADTLRRLGGTPDWLLEDPSLLEMVLPAVRADFSVKDTYVYREEPPLDVPITVLASDRDPRAEQAAQARWQEQTTAGCVVHTFSGGHFAVFEQVGLAHRRIEEALRDWL